MFEFQTVNATLKGLSVCEGNVLYVASDVILMLGEAFKCGT